MYISRLSLNMFICIIKVTIFVDVSYSIWKMVRQENREKVFRMQ